MAQGLLPFQYESEAGEAGLTGLAGLPLYLELWRAAGLDEAVARHVAVSGAQGWSDRQMVSALVLLNLAGGEGLDDLDRLEADSGLCRLVRAAEAHGRSRRERRAEAQRWRRQRLRALPSPDAAGRWLAGFHDAGEEARRQAGRAFIPASSEGIAGLWRVNGDLLQVVQAQHPATQATLDMDATLIETQKREALYCYKHFKAYQPLNTWWAEQGLIVHSEFRDGNVPAGHEQLRVLEAAARLLHTLGHGRLSAGSSQVLRRGQERALRSDRIRRRGGCDEGVQAGGGGTARVGLAAARSDRRGRALCRRSGMGGGRLRAELGRHEQGSAGLPLASAIREPLSELDLGDAEQLPFPTMSFGTAGRYKLFGLVTNRTLPGDDVIRWQRERCSKSEEARAVMKEDLADGRLPSGLFGANAAWWAIMVLAHNLNAMMKRLVLGGDWGARRMKAMRFHLIALPGRVVHHARRLIVRLSAGAVDLIRDARAAILALYPAPSG